MPNNQIELNTTETNKNDDNQSICSELSSYTTNDFLSAEIESITNELTSLQEQFLQSDASRTCLSLFCKPNGKSTAFLQRALEILDVQNNSNTGMRHDDRLRELRSLYVKHIKIFFIKKSDRSERSRTAQIQGALENTALG